MIFYWILPYKLSNVVQLKLRPTLRRALWEMYFLFPIFSLCDKGSDDTESESDERINVMFLRETPGRLVLKRQTWADPLNFRSLSRTLTFSGPGPATSPCRYRWPRKRPAGTGSPRAMSSWLSCPPWKGGVWTTTTMGSRQSKSQWWSCWWKSKWSLSLREKSGSCGTSSITWDTPPVSALHCACQVFRQS